MRADWINGTFLIQIHVDTEDDELRVRRALASWKVGANQQEPERLEDIPKPSTRISAEEV